jgi:hypothetical protein
MKTAIIVIISLVIGGLIGGLIGGFLAVGVGAGLGAGAGIVVGSQAGACLALETAKEQGMLSAGQVDQVIAGTVQKLRGKAGDVQGGPDWIGSEADCAKIIADLEKHAQEAQAAQ